MPTFENMKTHFADPSLCHKVKNIPSEEPFSFSPVHIISIATKQVESEIQRQRLHLNICIPVYRVKSDEIYCPCW